MCDRPVERKQKQGGVKQEVTKRGRREKKEACPVRISEVSVSDLKTIQVPCPQGLFLPDGLLPCPLAIWTLRSDKGKDIYWRQIPASGLYPGAAVG